MKDKNVLEGFKGGFASLYFYEHKANKNIVTQDFIAFFNYFNQEVVSLFFGK